MVTARATSRRRANWNPTGARANDFRAGIARIGGYLLWCCAARDTEHKCLASHVVSNARKAELEPAELGLWPGLDSPLPHDGRGRLAGVGCGKDLGLWRDRWGSLRCS